MKKVLHKVLFAAALVTAAAGTAQIISASTSEAAVAEPTAKFPPNVPAAVRNLDIELDELSTTGWVVFDMPDTMYDGTPQVNEDRCTYNIEVNGELTTANWWWCDRVESRLDASGHGELFTVIVWASNENGDGPKSTITKYVGEDQAAPVSDFNATLDGDTWTITWAPTHGVHGGNYDPGQVKYHLYAYPGEIAVGSYNHNVSEATYTMATSDIPTAMYFSMTLDYWDIEGWGNATYPAAYTEAVVLNPMSVPMTYSLSTSTASKSFGVFNMVPETNTWTFSGSGATVSYDNPEPKDDWLISMPIEMNTGTQYKLTVNAKNNGYDEILGLYVGNTPFPESMTTQVVEPIEFNEPEGKVFEGSFTVPEAGIYYIGFHATSKADQYNLTVVDMAIEVEFSLNGPAEVDNLVVEPYYTDDESGVRVAFNAPTLNMMGQPLTSLDKIVIKRNDEVIAEVPSVIPGEKVEHLDACGIGSYTYTIYAVSGEEEGAISTREVKVVKIYKPDFSYIFKDETETAALFIVVNTEGDKKTWENLSGTPSVMYNDDDATIGKDDWLISMPIMLTGGVEYTFTTEAHGLNNYNEKLQVCISNSPTVESMTPITEVGVSDRAMTLTGTYKAYFDQTVYLGFHAMSDPDMYTLYLDSFTAEATGTCETFEYNTNLAISDLTVDPVAIAGETIAINVKVANKGLNAVEAYTVDLYVDDVLTDSYAGGPIASAQVDNVELTFNSTIFHTDEMIMRAELKAEGDEDSNDDITDDYQVTLNQSKYPTVIDLDTTAEENNVTLTWSAPDVSGTGAETVTESFEDYPAFSIGLEGSEVENDNLGEWTVIDADENTCYVHTPSYVAPNFHSGTNKLAPRAWMIMNPSEVENYESSAATDMLPNTGNQLIVALGLYGGSKSINDDWLISPELSGYAQTISFVAKNFSNAKEELFEVLYSTTGKEIDDFTRIGDVNRVENAGEFSPFSFDLPEGAKYFAIRCVSNDAIMLCIDDITFEKVSPNNELKVAGYNVFRNKMQLNNELVAENTYTDSNVESGTHSYHVNAVYNRGFSAPSNMSSIFIDTTGVDTVETVDGITVATDNGTITVNGANGGLVEVYTIDGRLVASSNGSASFAVATGVYVVRTADSAVKVIVK